MPDIFTKEKRSWVMSRIRGKNTKPELFVEHILAGSGVGFIKHPALIGHPDFIVGSRNIALFVDGDFWHGYRMGPKALSSLSDFWRSKITKNKRRDRQVNVRLRKNGWTVVRVWEHEIEKNPGEASRMILEAVRSVRSG